MSTLSSGPHGADLDGLARAPERSRAGVAVRLRDLRRGFSLAVVVMASYAAGAAPDRTALYSAAAAASIALIAYLYQDRQSRLSREHDRQLYKRFLHELPADGVALRFLREPVTELAPREAIETLQRFLSGWHNVESEFVNEYLGSYLRQLQREIDLLLRLHAEYASSTGAPAATQQALRTRLLNAASAALLTHQSLVWQGRERL